MAKNVTAQEPLARATREPNDDCSGTHGSKPSNLQRPVCMASLISDDKALFTRMHVIYIPSGLAEVARRRTMASS